MKFRYAWQAIVKARLAIILLSCAIGLFAVLTAQAALSGESTSPPATAPDGPPPAGAPGTAPEGADTAAQASSEVPSTAPERIIPAQEKERIQQALMSDVFTFDSKNSIDPFDSFIKAPAPKFSAPALVGEEDTEQPLEPLTPLQKMTVAEIEKGLKGIILGVNGKRALIEDATGKGYIVEVGVPLGESNGVVTQIFGEGMVIQQQIKDRKTKEITAQNITVRLKKPETTK